MDNPLNKYGLKNAVRFTITALTASIASLLGGLAIGISSSASAQLKISLSWVAVFSSIINIGALIGSLLSGEMLSRLGRRRSLLFAGIPGILGWAMLRSSAGISDTSQLFEYQVLICGRILTGLSAGIYLAAVVPYLMEVTHPDSRCRGLIAGLNQMSVVCGILLAYVVGLSHTWYDACLYYLLINTILTLVLFLNCIPESPKWLLENGLRGEADSAHIWLHGTSILEMRVRKEASPQPLSNFNALDVLLPCRAIPSSMRGRLLIALALNIGQQCTGVNALMFFTEAICAKAGFSQPALCAVYIALMQAIFTAIVLFVVDKFPRRFLLQIGAFFCALGQVTFGMAKSYEADGSALLLSVAIFFIGYSLAWGPLPLLVSMELFPVSMRGPVSAACLAISWLVAYLITQYFLAMCALLGVPATFYLYGVMCLICGVFVRCVLPETNRPAIREVETSLSL